jgi:carboxyl-terminal processing protease
MILPFLLLFAAAPTEDLDKLLKRFIDVYAIAESEAADPVSADQGIYQGAIPGMLRRLDPHSVFFDPSQFEQLKEMEKSERKGFGSVVAILPGRVTVLQALPGTPSAKAGLAPGDEILAINDVRLDRLTFEQLIEFLGMARQRTAKLDVRRPGNVRLFQFVLNPELVDAPSVDRAFLLEPGVGYIRIASWDPQTARMFKEAIEKLGGEKLDGLVVDLRNNPGGVVQAALSAAELFLRPDQKLLTAKGRSFKQEEITVSKDARPYVFPLAVVINGKTASASEIFAGAMQDHDRAVIVGESSYGKGLVQSVKPLANNTAIALTTAFYYTPSGRSIQRPLQGGQLAVEMSKETYKTDRGRIVTGGGGIQPDTSATEPPPTRLQLVLEASGVLTSFATEYLQKHKVDANFTVTAAALDDFHVFASERGIQPGVGEWLQRREWIQNRIQQEIFNQALGVEKGDEVEVRADAQIRAARARLKTAP